MEGDKHYIVTVDLPAEQQAPFNAWMRGKTRPMIEAEGPHKYDCAFRWDYQHWLDKIYQPGQPIPASDDYSPITNR